MTVGVVAVRDHQRDPSIRRAWWRNAVVYQLYLRSFADSDGDGIGDLRGLSGRIGYLAELAIDAIWLNPFGPVPPPPGELLLTSQPLIQQQVPTDTTIWTR